MLFFWYWHLSRLSCDQLTGLWLAELTQDLEVLSSILPIIYACNFFSLIAEDTLRISSLLKQVEKLPTIFQLKPISV